ncbi:MAG: preprotein translocase subunit YajC [Phycisphaerae bacterium]|nr:preprotein translocase subunit YajC [Phycisphaerae bacterium]|tara:strand:- start:1541 stop:1990 length:450 start_codon:yes stop_codon:yes gene_type:complete
MNQGSLLGEIPLQLIGQASPPAQPPLGGAGGGAESVTGQPLPTGEAGAQGQPPGLFGGEMMLWIFVILFLFIGMSFLSQRKEKKRRKDMLSSLGKNSSVQTIGGIMGSVVEVKGDFVVLNVDKSSNTRMTFSRAAIQQVLEPGEKAADS